MSNPMPSPEALRHTRETHSGRALARDEAIVWQGAPSVLGIARRVLRGDLMLAYFAVLLVVGIVRASLGQTAWSAVVAPLALAMIASIIILGLARTIARSTRYIVTSRRVIIRYGAALPRSLSLPFSQICALSVAVGARGRGDIALRPRGDFGVRYLKLWPHARTWRLPEPMLRDVADAGLLATRLSRLLSDAEQARLAATTADFPAETRSAA